MKKRYDVRIMEYSHNTLRHMITIRNIAYLQNVKPGETIEIPLKKNNIEQSVKATVLSRKTYRDKPQLSRQLEVLINEEFNYLEGKELIKDRKLDPKLVILLNRGDMVTQPILIEAYRTLISQFNGNLSAIQRYLKIPRQSLYNKLKKLGLR